MVSTIACIGLGFVGLYFLKGFTRVLARSLPLPPGPKGLPLIGNLLNVPKARDCKKLKALCSQFNSDIIYFNILGRPIIVLDSVKAAEDLLEKRSSIYSDRPRAVMMNEVSGAGWNMGLMPYGQRWKDIRRVFHQGYQPGLLSQIPLCQLEATRMFLQRLLNNPPGDLRADIRRTVGQISLSATYGIDVVEDDPYLKIAETAIDAVDAAGTPEAYPFVQAFPILTYLPMWFPGAGFKRQGKKWDAAQKELRQQPLQYLKDSLAAGTARASIGSEAIFSMEQANTLDDPYEQGILEDALGVCTVPGTDTTTGAIYTFFLAMLTHPEIQRTGQQAVDEAVGSTRLPVASDNIPYVDAIVKELLRWRPISPIYEHSIKVEDVYRGYRIPAGTTVLFNQWSMLHDESHYGPNPEAFRPSRWLKDGKLNPAMPSIDVAFGFGRRFCAGQEMALKSIWIFAANVLATYNITHRLDAGGRPIIPSGEFTKGVFSYPQPFECAVTVRSEEAKALIQSGV